MFLVSVFLLDIFYFNKLIYIYKIIWLGFFPLFLRYLKYTLNTIKENFLKILDKFYDEISEPYYYEIFPGNSILDNNFYTKPEFVDKLTKAALNDEKNIFSEIRFNYTYNILCKEERYENYKKKKNKDNLQEKDYLILDKSFHRIFSIILNINIVLALNNNIENSGYFFNVISFKTIKIIIFFLYFFGWFIILIQSLHTLSSESYTIKMFLWILENIEDKTEPFSNSILYD